MLTDPKLHEQGQRGGSTDHTEGGKLIGAAAKLRRGQRISLPAGKIRTVSGFSITMVVWSASCAFERSVWIGPEAVLICLI